MNHYSLDGLLDLLHAAAVSARGGIAGVARRCGLPEQQLRNKLNPHNALKLPNIGEFVLVMEQTGNTEPLEYLCAMFGGRFATRTTECSGSLVAAVLHAAAEQGDVVRAAEDALADGRITEQERIQIIREVSEARTALSVLENTLAKEPRHG